MCCSSKEMMVFQHLPSQSCLPPFAVPQRNALLKVELAIVVHFWVNFIKTTYHLQGHGVLAFHCCEVIAALYVAVVLANYSNLTAVARELSGGNATVQQQLE